MDASPDRPANEEPASAPPSDALGNPLPPDVPASPPPEAPPRRGVSWLGIAVAGIGVVLAVLGVVSLLLSRDNGVSALDARLAGVELDLRDLAARAPPPAADPKALDAVAGRVAKLEAAGATPQVASDGALAARYRLAPSQTADGHAALHSPSQFRGKFAVPSAQGPIDFRQESARDLQIRSRNLKVPSRQYKSAKLIRGVSE